MKKLSALFLVLLLALFTGQTLFAQDGAVLSNEADKTGTMDELKISMDANNAQLAKARQTYIQSLLDVKNAKANYQPTINLLLTSTYMPNPPIGKMTISVDSLSSQLGIVVPGAVAGEYVTLYDGMKNIYYNAGLSITQPLFTWGKIPNAVKLYTQVAEIRALAIEDTSNQLTAQLKARVSALKSPGIRGTLQPSGTMHSWQPEETAFSRAPLVSRVGMSLPSSVSSPTAMIPMSPVKLPLQLWTALLRAIERAIGRSSEVPSFWMFDGLRFTRTLFWGNPRPLALSADLTRSLASLTAVPGSPVMSNPGKPFRIRQSTTISWIP